MKLKEALNIDLKIGDEIMTGKFKNKRVKVKTISYDDLGQLMINGKKAFTFRISKAMPDKGEKK